MKIITIEITAKNNNEAIEQCGLALQQAGMVGGPFIRGCLEREKEFPTGLPTTPPVAIPHTLDVSVVQSAICYARLKEPVTFMRMDTMVDELLVSHVFCMALENEQSHIYHLQRLITSFQSEDFLKQLSLQPFSELSFLLERTLLNSPVKCEKD